MGISIATHSRLQRFFQVSALSKKCPPGAGKPDAAPGAEKLPAGKPDTAPGAEKLPAGNRTPRRAPGNRPRKSLAGCGAVRRGNRSPGAAPCAGEIARRVSRRAPKEFKTKTTS